jgi:hypothetical protein
MPHVFTWGTLCWVSKGALNNPLVKHGIECPVREGEHIGKKIDNKQECDKIIKDERAGT